MIIHKPTDIEEQIRTALNTYLTVYVRPLPASYSLPNIMVTANGGSTANTIDTFTVTLSSRAETDAEALEYLNDALGILAEQAAAQVNGIRNVTINSLASWGTDPARPDLKLCTATVLVTAHRESKQITTNT